MIDESNLKISCLFLTKNRKATVERCMRSLEYLLRRDDILEWIILDNASTDDTAAWLYARYSTQPKVNVFLTKENTGVAGGRHFLMQQAQGTHFLILDSDVLDNKHLFLPVLIAGLETPDTGIVGLHGTNINAEWSWINSFKTAGFADGVSGFCQLFSRDVFDAGCELDQFYNPYWLEDTDFCLQIRHKLKLRSLIVNPGRDLLVHKWGKTCAGPDSHRKIRWEYFVKKWHDIHEGIKLIDTLVHVDDENKHIELFRDPRKKSINPLL